jgi:hypothetical protein
VSAVALFVGDRDLPPGQPDQLGVQLRLVRLRDQDVVGAAVVQVVGVPALGMQCVGGEQHVGQVDAVEQRSERGDLVGLPVDSEMKDEGGAAVVGLTLRRLTLLLSWPGSAGSWRWRRFRVCGRAA